MSRDGPLVKLMLFLCTEKKKYKRWLKNKILNEFKKALRLVINKDKSTVIVKSITLMIKTFQEMDHTSSRLIPLSSCSKVSLVIADSWGP